MNRLHSSAPAAIARHPIHATPAPFPIVCFTLTLLPDIAYWRTSKLAARAGAVGFPFRPEVRAPRPAWPPWPQVAGQC
ncbi:MAG: hypothetical protein BroJett029_11210 [Alphaproteobacteria bacterium]|nr:MAG: hypothetical protein BroJett029_11210 [Alphaproteobacteria bacterium]